jgi:AraC-like DNA-binding protein
VNKKIIFSGFLLSIIGSISAALFFIFFFSVQEYVIFPAHQPKESISFFTDITAGGNSKKIKEEIHGNSIIFGYMLKKGIDYPYAGLSIDLRDKGTLCNLSSYNYLKLKISSTSPRPLLIALKSYIPGFTNFSHHVTSRLLSMELQATREQEYYVIPLSDFYTPTWWYSVNNILPEDIPPESYKNIISFEVHDTHNSQEIPDESYAEIRIQHISFMQGTMHIVIITACGLLLIIFLIAVFPTLLKRRIKTGRTNDDTLQYTHIQTINYRERDLGRIMEIIRARYFDPDISTQTVSAITGISKRKISTYVKNSTGYSFSNMVNNLRIREAKRLLKETDLSVTDIAFKVGFNNPTYFITLFKKSETISPSGYRKKIT